MHHFLIGLLLLIASTAQAIPFTNADAFIDGDGQAICEIDTGLFWLDFGITNNKSFNDIQAELDTTYAGWRLPTEQEVKNLWNGIWFNGHLAEHGYRMDGREELERDAYYDSIFSLWGVNETWLSEILPSEEYPIGSYYNHSNSGIFLNEKNQLQSFNFAQISASVFSAVLHESFATCCFSLSLDAFSIHSSTLLVKDADSPVYLPEPTPFILFGLGLLMLAINRFKRGSKNLKA
jgi:hypothetical protein